ncbi:hypothetical protein [Peribacillus muralis]|uniref:hypothetical protein n=1 Tax=Peribacillus muralis TaxID=264697 RepID=UPI00366C1726
MDNLNSILVFTHIGMKRKATRLLRDMRVYVRPRRLKAEEAHGPPAESECLQCNETVNVHNVQQANGNPLFVLTHTVMLFSAYFEYKS